MSENNSNDMIYNWRNELRSHQDGMYVVANSQAQKYKNQGFDKSEVVELLAADNFDLDVANRVASKLFDTADNAKEFVKRLCSGQHSIIKTDEKGLQQWNRWAEMAKTSRNGMDNLHVALKPFIEETLLNNVLIAQSQTAEIKTASKNKYVVSMRKGSAEVDLLSATSTSDKFTQGNYADFGLADEYLVKAADTVSPYQRLKRALAD